jgi:hypothetical protein
MSRMLTFVQRALPGRRFRPPPQLLEDQGGWFDYFDEKLSGCLNKDQLARAVIKTLGRNSGVDHDEVRAIIESIWGVFAGEEEASIKRDTFTAEGGLWEAIAAALPQSAENARLERQAAHERHGEVPGRPCGGCGKIHVYVGDRVSRLTPLSFVTFQCHANAKHR